MGEEALPLILASSSPYRRALMERLGLHFEQESPDCDEVGVREVFVGTPIELATQLARMKAKSVADRRPGRWIIGSDQLVSLGGKILSKAGSAEAAVEQLAALQGETHELITALCLIDPGGSVVEDCVIHHMRMRSLSEEELRRYVTADEPWDCAGSYKVERLGICLFESIEGPDFTAIMGLPLVTLVGLLRARGIFIP